MASMAGRPASASSRTPNAPHRTGPHRYVCFAIKVSFLRVPPTALGVRDEVESSTMGAR